MKCEVCRNDFDVEALEGYGSARLTTGIKGPYCQTDYLLADKYPPPIQKVFGAREKILVRL